jgi:hypothetical protein
MTLTYYGVYDKCRDFASNVSYNYGNVGIRERVQKVRAGYNTFLCVEFSAFLFLQDTTAHFLSFFIPLDEMQTFYYFNAQTLRNIFLSTHYEKSYLYKMQTRKKYFN